jgi:DNA polymerase-3 subunit chi
VTGIDFHFNAPDKVLHACRLLRKALRSPAVELVVVGEPDTLNAVDSSLWALSAIDFIPHCRSDSAAHVLARSPVVLMATQGGPVPHRKVLVNLGASLPDGFERFDRLIDIVSRDPIDRQVARSRWRHYSDRGYAITRHDFSEVTA